MGSAVSGIANAVSGVGNSISKATGIGNAGMAVNPFLFGANNMFASPSAPQAPGVDPNLQALKDQQMQNAQQFRQNLPGMEQQMGNQLKSASQQQLGQNLNYTKDYNNSRGLLYGGVNQGMQQQQRAQAAGNLAGGISNINTGLLNAANQLDAQAIETGVGIQQTQQSIQNQLYSQSLAQQQSQNSMIGGAASTGLLLAMMA